jgi:DNA-binding response OmpR family regulator
MEVLVYQPWIMRKILAVDDDSKILKTLEVALVQKGYEVMTTTDPSGVGALLDVHEFDLIMLDVCMPAKNGFELFGELKKRKRAHKFLFVTGYPKAFTVNSSQILEMWQRDFADGETDIIYKPFTLSILYEKVEGLIGSANE